MEKNNTNIKVWNYEAIEEKGKSSFDIIDDIRLHRKIKETIEVCFPTVEEKISQTKNETGASQERTSQTVAHNEG